MTSDIIIIDEPFIWTASLKNSATVIELTKVTNQQYFLVGSDAEMLAAYFQQINKREVKRIDAISKTSPYSSFGDMDLLLINLN